MRGAAANGRTAVGCTPDGLLRARDAQAVGGLSVPIHLRQLQDPSMDGRRPRSQPRTRVENRAGCRRGPLPATAEVTALAPRRPARSLVKRRDRTIEIGTYSCSPD